MSGRLELWVLRNFVQTMEARPKFDMGFSKLRKLYVQGLYNVKRSDHTAMGPLPAREYDNHQRPEAEANRCQLGC
jgi:hypothetical protein